MPEDPEQVMVSGSGGTMRAWWRRWRPWAVLLGAIAYDVWPMDAIPDAPLVGWADDLGVTGMAVVLAWTWWRQRRRERANEAKDSDPAAR